MDALNERISRVIEYSKLSASEFADEIGVQRSSVSHITSGRNKPSLDFLIKVKDRFPALEWNWLIKGDGEMLRQENKPEPVEIVKPKNIFPDLFAMANDETFGTTESEDRIQKQNPRESAVPDQPSAERFTDDSQRLENKISKQQILPVDNQQHKICRIVIFYESGKFESFEP